MARQDWKKKLGSKTELEAETQKREELQKQVESASEQFKRGTQETTGQTTEEVLSKATPFQQQYFKNLLEQAGGVVSGLDPSQTAAIGRAQQRLGGQGADLANLAAGSAQQMLGPYDPSRAQGAVEAATRPVFRQLRETELPGVAQGAIAAGQMGGTRQGIAEGIAMRGAAEKAQDIGAQIGYQDYARDQAQRMNVLQNLSNIQQGLISPDVLSMGLGGQEQQNLANQLAAYRDLISGNMGMTQTGTTTGRQQQIGTTDMTGGRTGTQTANVLSDINERKTGATSVAESAAGSGTSEAGSGAIFGNIAGGITSAATPVLLDKLL